MKKVLYFIVLMLTALAIETVAQNSSIFPKGEKAPNDHHVGTVYLKELNAPDNVFTYSTAVATFEPASYLYWHKHPAGQILMITDGTGYYQEKGKPRQTVHKGDVIKCLPSVEHWHGASPESGFAYIATTPAQKGRTIWLSRVTDQEYGLNVKTSSTNSTNAEQELINLSKKKWQWMADKKADTLANLFHEKAVFVHMGGSWGKDQEVNVIRSGGIHYKKADIHEVSVNIIGNTAILLNRITLLAVVGGNEVTNPFMVTEIYVKENDVWKLGSLSFTKLLTPGQ
jgi:4-carboxymuconolactone decarboxylase